MASQEQSQMNSASIQKTLHWGNFQLPTNLKGDETKPPSPSKPPRLSIGGKRVEFPDEEEKSPKSVKSAYRQWFDYLKFECLEIFGEFLLLLSKNGLSEPIEVWMQSWKLDEYWTTSIVCLAWVQIQATCPVTDLAVQAYTTSTSSMLASFKTCEFLNT